MIMAAENLVQASDLGLEGTYKSQNPDLGQMSLEEVEALLMGKALARYRGNIKRAAELLGLSRGTFYRRMEKYGLYVSNTEQNENP